MGDRSVSARDIKQSVVVTGNGNNVALTFGDSGIGLPLERKQFPPPDRRRQPRPGEPPRELDLLTAGTGRLPLIGRQDLLAELRAWCDDEADLSVYGLIGRAGTGKTRLAIEFCKTIDNDPGAKGDWVAGFVSPTRMGPVVEALATRDFAWERNTLLVIDYAAQCHEALARWLDWLARDRQETKLRFLLLDREAPDAFGWWQALTVLGPPSRRDLFCALRPQQLPDLADREERRALLTATLQAARELHAASFGGTPIPTEGADPDFDRRLAEPQFGNPLNLVMAGIIALDRGPQAALALRRLDAARRIARRELRRLTDLAISRHIDEDEIRHIVAFHGLAGGLPIADLRKTVADELTLSGRSTNRLAALLSLLQQEFPPRTEAGQQPRLATIQPDLIGEATIVETFIGEPAQEAEAADVVRRAYALTAEAAAQALIRIVQDFAYSLEDPGATDEERSIGGQVMSWLLNLAEKIDDPEQLVPLVFALPHQTTILREPAAELTQKLAAHFLGKAQASDDLLAVVLAGALLNSLANRLSDLGRREEALQNAEEAERLRRALAEARPDAFLPDLAGSLHNLANMLSALGRREDALQNAEEAVRLRRALAEARPDAFLPDLALSLNNLATMLSDLGRREEALQSAEEAVSLRRALAAARPDAFIPDLATSLNNLGSMLSALGRREDALRTAEEAVSLRRALAAARPDAFIPDLASSLSNLANRLSDLGRREDALRNAEEAAQHYRALSAARPDAFGVELARSLWVLGDLYGDNEKTDLAVSTLAEAIQSLTPTFLRVSQAVAGMMAGLGRSYLARCEAIGRAPDEELLGPLLAVFEKLQKEEGKK